MSIWDSIDDIKDDFDDDACEVCDNCGELFIECVCHEDELTAAQAEQILESMNDLDNLDEDEEW